jgi:hypothetical protein
MSIIEKIRSLHASLNPYVNILVTGDKSKSAYLPLWGIPSKIPNVYIKNIDNIHCALWDVPEHTDNTNRMFFSDDLDYCIIIYDIPYRQRVLSLDTLPSIIEYIHQTKVYKLEVVVIIIKDETTRPEDYETPRDYCNGINMPPIIVDRKGLAKIQNLTETLCKRAYQQRKADITREIKLLISQSHNHI